MFYKVFYTIEDIATSTVYINPEYVVSVEYFENDEHEKTVRINTIDDHTYHIHGDDQIKEFTEKFEKYASLKVQQ